MNHPTRFRSNLATLLAVLALVARCSGEGDLDVWQTDHVSFGDPDSRTPSDAPGQDSLGTDHKAGCDGCTTPDVTDDALELKSDQSVPADSLPADTTIPDTATPDTYQPPDNVLPTDVTVPDQNIEDTTPPDLAADSAPTDVTESEDQADPCTSNDPQHCGPLCLVCQGETPHCKEGVCSLCNSAETCGPTCTACPPQTPVCRPDGVGCVQCIYDPDCPVGQYCSPQATCVACLDDTQCPVTEVCDPISYVCVPDAPTEGCDSDTSPNAYTCAKAKIIGRAAVAGVSKSFTGFVAANSANDDDVGSCDDGSDEEFYRIYLGAGQTMNLDFSTYAMNYDPVLKVYSGTNCDNSGTEDLITCSDTKTGTAAELLQFVAPADGWYSIVVDGYFSGSTMDDIASYTLKVQVTCLPAHCGCL